MHSFIIEYANTEYIKYFFCGGFNTLLTFIIYCAGIRLGFPYYVANSIAWLIGLIVSFILNGRLVFKSTYQHKQFLLFIISNSLSLIISLILLGFLIDYAHLNPIIASIVTIPCIVIFNFLTSKYFVFKSS